MLSLIVVGDVHAGKDNLAQVEELFVYLLALVENVKKVKGKGNMPHAIVFLGDMFDRFENINMHALCLVNKYLVKISKVLNVLVLVGNHDRANPTDFQSDIHPFNNFNHEYINIIDRAKSITFNTNDDKVMHRIVMVPYVQPGRFHEALGTLKKKIDEGVRPSLVFCHQEFKGVDLGAGVASVEGDAWGKDMPFVISGHIHKHHYLQENILYAGTPYQISSAEESDKGILFVTVDNERNVQVKRIKLNITNKMIVKLLPSEVEEFIRQQIDNTKKQHAKVLILAEKGDAEAEKSMELLKASGFTNSHYRRVAPSRICPSIGDTMRANNPGKMLNLKDVWFELLKQNPGAMNIAMTAPHC